MSDFSGGPFLGWLALWMPKCSPKLTEKTQQTMTGMGRRIVNLVIMKLDYLLIEMNLCFCAK